MKKLIARFLFYLTGWTIIGEIPKEKKYVLVVAPHTSNWDFFLGILSKYILDFDPKYLAKDSLFKFPFGMMFRALGGYPVDRSKNTKLVDEVIEIFDTHDEFIMTVAPEGTRSPVGKWKTGFYHIAIGANVPIFLVSFDYEKRQVILGDTHYADPDKEKEMQRIYDFFKNVKPKNPEKFILPTD